MTSIEPREMCERCQRPRKVCWCAHLPTIETRTRVVILQHPREEHMPIGTARMASLSLPSSKLFVGVALDEDADVRAAIEDPSHPAVLLYPGPAARDLDDEPPEGPITLVVLDGTWAHARKLLRKNPRIAALPRYAFRPPKPSEYRIRREPLRDYVSTIEAVAHALTCLEQRDVGALYDPFRAMVDKQIECRETLKNSRGRHAMRVHPPRPVPFPLRELKARASRLVLVTAEANAWPYDQPDSPPDELVHFLAVRPFERDVLDVIVAPRHAIAPSTPSHTSLTTEALTEGATLDELRDRWRAFLREDDILCSWGYYAAKLLKLEGLPVPTEIFDLRTPASAFAQGRPGSLDEFLPRLGRPDAPPLGRGRGGERLGRIVTIGEILLTETRPVRSAAHDRVAMLPAP